MILWIQRRCKPSSSNPFLTPKQPIFSNSLGGLDDGLLGLKSSTADIPNLPPDENGSSIVSAHGEESCRSIAGKVPTAVFFIASVALSERFCYYGIMTPLRTCARQQTCCAAYHLLIYHRELHSKSSQRSSSTGCLRSRSKYRVPDCELFQPSYVYHTAGMCHHLATGTPWFFARCLPYLRWGQWWLIATLADIARYCGRFCLSP